MYVLLCYAALIIIKNFNNERIIVSEKIFTSSLIAMSVGYMCQSPEFKTFILVIQDIKHLWTN